MILKYRRSSDASKASCIGHLGHHPPYRLTWLPEDPIPDESPERFPPFDILQTNALLNFGLYGSGTTMSQEQAVVDEVNDVLRKWHGDSTVRGWLSRPEFALSSSHVPSDTVRLLVEACQQRYDKWPSFVEHVGRGSIKINLFHPVRYDDEPEDRFPGLGFVMGMLELWGLPYFHLSSDGVQLPGLEVYIPRKPETVV